MQKNQKDEQERKQGHWEEPETYSRDLSLKKGGKDTIKFEGLSTGNYKDDKRHGKWLLSSFNGEIVEEGWYEDDKKNGHWHKRLFSPGTPHYMLSSGTYKDDKKHGHWREELELDLPASKGGKGLYVFEGEYVDDEKDDLWTVKRPDGTVVHQTWRNGKLITSKKVK